MKCFMCKGRVVWQIEWRGPMLSDGCLGQSHTMYACSHHISEALSRPERGITIEVRGV